MAEDASRLRILVPVSTSNRGYPIPSVSSDYAFNWILEKLIPKKCTKEYKLLILHVLVPDEDGFDDMDSVYATAQDFKDVQHRETKRGLALLEYFVKRSNEAQVVCEAWIKQGDPKEIICDEILRVQADLLVIGSRALNKFQQMFVGSASTHCLRNAACPVTVVKRPLELAPEDPLDD